MELRKVGNKRGFATVNAIISGLITLGFLIVFAFIFFTQLSDDTLTGSGTAADGAVDSFIGNYSEGVADVNVQIPTILTIGAFVLVVSILVIAFVFARRNGLIGGSTQLG